MFHKHTLNFPSRLQIIEFVKFNSPTPENQVTRRSTQIVSNELLLGFQE